MKSDIEQFEDLYDRYVKKIYDFIYFRTYHKETAEDLTSITFTKALGKLSSFNPDKGNFSSWLYRIARNTVIDHYRTNKPTFDIEEVFDLKGSEDFERDFDVQDQLAEVQKYLKKLKPELRELVIMRVWDGLSYREIAEITGKSEDSCKVAFSRVMAKLKMEVPYAVVVLFLINIIK